MPKIMMLADYRLSRLQVRLKQTWDSSGLEQPTLQLAIGSEDVFTSAKSATLVQLPFSNSSMLANTFLKKCS